MSEKTQSRMRENRTKRDLEARRKERFTVSVHPLFVLFGIWFLFRRELFLFLVYTLVAVIHECGHASYAAKIGCRLNRLRLLPCGAIVSGDIEGIPLSDEIRLALAGPLVNLACAAAFVALWWLVPDCYPYTETAATASFFLFAVNLLPAYPLDGGRILYCLLRSKKEVGFCRKTMIVVGITLSAGLAALFVVSCFSSVNFSILFFALFILFGTFGAKDERYTRFFSDFTTVLSRGAPVRRVAVLQTCTVRRILSLSERGKLLVIDVCGADGLLLGTVSQSEFIEFASHTSLNTPIGDFLAEKFDTANNSNDKNNFFADSKNNNFK